MKTRLLIIIVAAFVGILIYVDSAYAIHTDDGAHTTPFKYPPPLKQIKNGVALIDIQCNERKHVVYKRDRMRAACVTPETENHLIFERGWATIRLGLPATDNLPRDLCDFYQGKWIAEYKECELLENPLQCSLMGGKYNECASACRNAPEYPTVICTNNCIEVCIVEFSTLEDIKNHPLVDEFYAKYTDAHEEVRSDYVSYVVGNDDDFKVKMNLYFDENYDLDYINLKCYVDRELQSDVSGTFISKYLKDYTCDEYGSQRNEN